MSVECWPLLTTVEHSDFLKPLNINHSQLIQPVMLCPRSACRHYFINHSQLIQPVMLCPRSACRHYFINHSQLIQPVMLCPRSACRHYLIKLSHFFQHANASLITVLLNRQTFVVIVPIAGGNTVYLIEVHENWLRTKPSWWSCQPAEVTLNFLEIHEACLRAKCCWWSCRPPEVRHEGCWVILIGCIITSSLTCLT